MMSRSQQAGARTYRYEGNRASLHAKRRELLRLAKTLRGGAGGTCLEELLYCREKHVGRFPERHVPGGGYHDVLS